MLIYTWTSFQLCTPASSRVSQLEEAVLYCSICHCRVGLPVRTTSLPGLEVRMSRSAYALPLSAPVSCFSGLWARRNSVNPDSSAVLCFSRSPVLTVCHGLSLFSIQIKAVVWGPWAETPYTQQSHWPPLTAHTLNDSWSWLTFPLGRDAIPDSTGRGCR